MKPRASIPYRCWLFAGLFVHLAVAQTQPHESEDGPADAPPSSSPVAPPVPIEAPSEEPPAPSEAVPAAPQKRDEIHPVGDEITTTRTVDGAESDTADVADPAAPSAPEQASAPATGAESASASASQEGDDGEASEASVPCDPEPESEDKAFTPYSWDPRAGYGLCDRVCDVGEACVDGRCLARCSPNCREGTYCTPSGQCMPMPTPPKEEETESELQTRLGSPSAGATMVVSADVAGVLFRGVRPTLEWGRKNAFLARLLLMNTGLMNYFEEPTDGYERFEWGFGVELGYRRYEAKTGNLRGFYYGGSLGYSLSAVGDFTSELYTVQNHRVGVLAEFGYRWVFDHLVFGFGPTLGLRVPVHERFRSTGSGSCVEDNSCDRPNPLLFEGTLAIEVGWFP